MEFAYFVDLSGLLWHEYFTSVYESDLRGDVDSGGGVMMYPTILLCTETSRHYITELMGAVRYYQPLEVKTHRESSTVRYLSQFNEEAPDPAIILGASRHQIVNLTLSQGIDIDSIADRFPFVRLRKGVLVRVGGRSALIGFSDKFESAVFENCLLINKQSVAIRVKHVLFIAVVSRNISEGEYRDFLVEMSVSHVRGVHTVPEGEAEDFAVARQFTSTYLFPGLRETTIGEFLRKHPAIIKRALGTRRFIYEPSFEWRDELHSAGDNAINPDLLVERKDGFFDIYDLKTAALDRESITKGPRRRRRFIDYVEEGVAQLAHYRDYFTHAANANYAFEKHGVRVKDPALVHKSGSQRSEL